MPRNSVDTNVFHFEGFDKPEANWFKMPNYWTDITAEIKTLAELKVIEYVLRHTWGFQEYAMKKHITVDEFVSGRKRQDGTRIDRGTGLSERSVQYGLKDAVAHGFLEEETDSTDRGRVKKYYSLSMRPDNSHEIESNPDSQLGVQNLHPRAQELRGRGAKAAPRTEKETIERHFEETNPVKSNSIEIQMQRFNGGSHSKFSKEAVENLKNDESEEESPRDEPEEQRRESYQPLTPSTNRLIAVGDVLRNRQVTRRGKTPPSGSKTTPETAYKPRAGAKQGRGKTSRPEPPQWLVDHITRLSGELHDDSHTEDNVAQATNLFLFTGGEASRFADKLNEAKRITLGRDIQKRAEGEAGEMFGQRNKAPYFFKVLRDVLGLKDVPASKTRPKASKSKSRGQPVNEAITYP